MLLSEFEQNERSEGQQGCDLDSNKPANPRQNFTLALFNTTFKRVFICSMTPSIRLKRASKSESLFSTVGSCITNTPVKVKSFSPPYQPAFYSAAN